MGYLRHFSAIKSKDFDNRRSILKLTVRYYQNSYVLAFYASKNNQLFQPVQQVLYLLVEYGIIIGILSVFRYDPYFLHCFYSKILNTYGKYTHSLGFRIKGRNTFLENLYVLSKTSFASVP